MDVMMPGMDGWAVLSRLKAEPATADVVFRVCNLSAAGIFGSERGRSAARPCADGRSANVPTRGGRKRVAAFS